MNKYFVVFLAICLVSIRAVEVPEEVDHFKDTRTDLSNLKKDIDQELNQVFKPEEVKAAFAETVTKLHTKLDEISDEINSLRDNANSRK